MQQGTSKGFLDVGGIHFQYLQSKGLIGEAEEVEAEELHRMVANARVKDLDTHSRRALKQFEEAEEMPPDNKYTKELAFRVEKRLLKEAIERLAQNGVTL